VVTVKEGKAELWQNRARDRADAPHVLRIRLGGPAEGGAADAINRDAIGAEVTVSAGGWRQMQRVRSGSSYASQSELALTFGLGDRDTVDAVTIRWPDGSESELDAAALAGTVDHELHVVQGQGVVERIPLAGGGR